MKGRIFSSTDPRDVEAKAGGLGEHSVALSPSPQVQQTYRLTACVVVYELGDSRDLHTRPERR